MQIVYTDIIDAYQIQNKVKKRKNRKMILRKRNVENDDDKLINVFMQEEGMTKKIKPEQLNTQSHNIRSDYACGYCKRTTLELNLI